ncbi:MAG: TetR/AcrR family transcriptional regulator [Actinomycetota bacterium]
MRKVDPAKHEARRQQVIDAAAALFAEKGLDGTTTAEICRAAGMSSGNVFHYFSSKREIFYALITHDEDEKAEQLAAAQTMGDPWQGLLAVVDLLAAPATVPLGPPLVMEAMIQAHRDPELAAWLERDQANEHAAVEALVARATERGQIDPGRSPRHTASWIIALVGALFLQAATDSDFDPAAEVATLHVILHRFLRGPADEPTRGAPEE